ncbi:MAG: hypothetical protein JSW15_09440 [Deltaproteobacteria bacterium]|nr:MAG: hypothetical protein JSW15_09440 [Deltaproteobacteria bacterium]
MRSGKAILTALIILLFAGISLADEEIMVVSWNTESGGANPDTVAVRIASMNGVDLWGLCEVKDINWALAFENAAEDGEPGDFKPLLGTTGNTDRLLILYDKTQFDEIGHQEIGWEDRYWFRPTMNPRSALVAHLRHKSTGQEFFFMVNHLYRGSAVDPRRLDQAKRLREWASKQSIPIIAVGDYNFDWDLDPEDARHNDQKGFGDMTACGVFKWLKPENPVRTHDSTFNSILDFVFLANAEGKITGTSRVVVVDGDFPDNEETPDHRPVQATLEFKHATQGDTLKEQLQKRVAEIESELDRLKGLIIQLPNQ